MATPNIFSLEQEKADLEVALAESGQYIPDGYGCVDWEPMSEFHIKTAKKRLEKINNDLAQLYKQPAYLIAKTNFINIIQAYITNISPEAKKN